MADIYTHGHTAGVLQSHSWRTAENSAAYLLPYLTPGKSLLDIGSGPGSISQDFANRLGASGKVVAIDQAESVIEKVKQETPVDLPITFCVGDAYNLDFEDNSFDIVHAHQVLQHLSDPVAALKEMLRVCKPGGVVAVRDADYAGMTWAPDGEGLQKWMEVYQATARSNKGEPNAGRHLLGWAQTAGAKNIEPSASVWCFTSEEEKTWWGGLWAKRVLNSSLADQAVERDMATTEDLHYISQAFTTWAQTADGWFTVPHGELLIHV